MTDDPAGGTRHDLLREPLFGTLDADGHRGRLDLAQILARLGAGQELEFTALQAHQQQAWAAFLVQLAAMALDRVELDEAQQDFDAADFGTADFDAGDIDAGDLGKLDYSADQWRRAIRHLANHHTSFCLVVDDLEKPAFFQPPVPEGSLANWKNTSTSPDLYDVRVTAKNFDVKIESFSAPADPEHWAYALLTLQTMQGFSGRGNYGIARMNGGFASRPEVGLVHDLGWASRFCREVPLLREDGDSLRENFGYAEEGGLALVWEEPWDGTAATMVSVDRLDPFFLEVCRRVRLAAESGGRIRGRMLPTQAARIDAKIRLGFLGDPWTPIRRKDHAALTISERGFDYRKTHELLLGSDFAPNRSLVIQEDDDGALYASFRALARGQGKTGGFHERRLRMPRKVGRTLRLSAGRDALAAESQERLERVAEAKSALKFALVALVQERPNRDEGERYNFKDDRPDPWTDQLDQAVDRVFFESFFRDLEEEESPEARAARWDRQLATLTREVYERALDALEPPGPARFRARNRSRALFFARLLQALPRARKEAEAPPPEAPLPDDEPALDSRPEVSPS